MLPSLQISANQTQITLGEKLAEKLRTKPTVNAKYNVLVNKGICFTDVVMRVDKERLS